MATEYIFATDPEKYKNKRQFFDAYAKMIGYNCAVVFPASLASTIRVYVSDYQSKYGKWMKTYIAEQGLVVTMLETDTSDIPRRRKSSKQFHPAKAEHLRGGSEVLGVVERRQGESLKGFVYAVLDQMEPKRQVRFTCEKAGLIRQYAYEHEVDNHRDYGYQYNEYANRLTVFRRQEIGSVVEDV